MSKIVITGGAGYIGSHIAVELMTAGYKVVIVDNFCNSSSKVLDRLHRLCGNHFDFVEADVRDGHALDQIFQKQTVSGVIHLAALKAVGESVAQPLRYFDNNLGSTITLLQTMERFGVHRLVFSSSATVYGDPKSVPITESSKLQATNPYGRSKLMCEDMLRDMQVNNTRWHVAILRYFNPVGAHKSGLIGEHPKGMPNNLMPFITQVAAGKREFLSIFGNDYPTPDGTGVRDYIHVVDLAKGHLAAFNYLLQQQKSITVNLGTGRGVSVKELINTFTKVNGVTVPFKFAERRVGDVASCYADNGLALRQLGWKANYDLARMCKDAWHWELANIN